MFLSYAYILIHSLNVQNVYLAKHLKLASGVKLYRLYLCLPSDTLVSLSLGDAPAAASGVKSKWSKCKAGVSTTPGEEATGLFFSLPSSVFHET